MKTTKAHKTQTYLVGIFLKISVKTHWVVESFSKKHFLP